MNTTTFTMTNGDQIIMERDAIEVRHLFGHHKPDPAWTFTDSHGHEHHWNNGYPTLTLIQEPDYVVMGDGYPEEHPGNSWYQCIECGEHIEPTTIYEPPSPYPTYIPGLISLFLVRDGKRTPISREDYEALAAQMSPVSPTT